MSEWEQPEERASRGAKRNSKDLQGTLLQFKNTIRGAHQSGLAALSRARDVLPAAQFPAAISWLANNPQLFHNVLPNPFPKKITDLNVAPPWSKSSLNAELRWASAYLRIFAARIRSFVQMASQVSELTFQDRHIEARTIVDRIEAEFGQSMWLIKTKIYVSQATEGLDRQKVYARKVREDARMPGYAPFVAYHTSVRNEPLVTYQNFVDRIHESLGASGVRPDMANYFRNHLLGTQSIEVGPDAIGDVLRHEGVGAVIDYYEALIQAARLVIANRLDSDFVVVRQALAALRPVDDPRLERLLLELGETTARPRVDQDAIAALASVLQGQRIGPETSGAFDVAELCARSTTGQPYSTTATAPDAARAMTGIAQRSGDVAADIARLRKLAANVMHLNWGLRLAAFLAYETSDTWPPSDAIMRMGSIAETTIHPLRIMYSPTKEERERVVQIIDEVCDDSTVLAYCHCLVYGGVLPPEVDDDERIYCEALNAFLQEDYGQSKDLAEKLAASPSAYHRNQGIRLHAHSLLRLGEIPALLERCATSLESQPGASTLLPLRDLHGALDRRTRRALAANICLPVVLDQLSASKGLGNLAERVVALEQFLRAHNVTHPSDLEVDEFPKKLLVYMLRKVCVESLLEKSLLFASSLDVINERLAIAQLLQHVDDTKGTEYQDEVRSLTRRIALYRHRREVDQSRVYVDVERVRAAAHRDLREDYDRYGVFVRQGLAGDVPNLRMMLQKLRHGERDALVELALPDNEANALLIRTLERLRYEFIFSTEYGLDGYLSVRIRHGSLAGQIRGALERAELVTQFDKGSSRYKENPRWSNDSSTPRERTAVTTMLSSFSAAVDRLIAVISGEWVQVRTPERPAGMLEIEWTKPGVATLASIIDRENSTFDEFLDAAFALLLNSVENSLIAIRKRLSRDAAPQFNELLTRLQREAETAMSPDAASEFGAHVANARTDLQAALGRIADWFQLTRAHRGEPFDIQVAVDLAVSSVQRFCPRFSCEVVVTPEERPLVHGFEFANFFDIFFILLENVTRHSELLEPTARVAVRIDEAELFLRITNPVSASLDRPQADVRLREIRARIESGEFMRSIRTEGGTGLCKVAKIVARDFKSDATVEFGFHEEEFEVAFVLSHHIEVHATPSISSPELLGAEVDDESARDRG